MEYREGNIPLAKQILLVLDMVHYCVSKIVYIDNITKLDNTECYMNDDDDDVDDDDSDDDDDDDLGQTLLRTLTKTEYTDIRIILEKQGVTTVLSHYMITTNRPEMTTLFYGKENIDYNSATTTVDLLPQFDSCIETTRTECNIKQSIQDKDININIKALTKRFRNGLYEAGMIVDDYSDYLSHMINNHIASGRSLLGNVVVFDGYDGAVHISSTNNEIGIVSFSSLVFSESFFEDGIITATSESILTWMQSITGKSSKTLLPLLTPIFESQKKLRAAVSSTMEGVTFCYYQCHDAKCIYVLINHRNWNRLKKPFLLCKSNKGEGSTRYQSCMYI